MKMSNTSMRIKLDMTQHVWVFYGVEYDWYTLVVLVNL